MAIPSASFSAENGRDHLRVVDEHAAIPVVLVCAGADAAVVAAATRLLGGCTEIVDDLDVRVDALREAARLAGRPTLFVVCKTTALSPASVRSAVESYGARSAAGHRLLVLELLTERSAGFVGTLRRARAQLGRACERAGIAPPSVIRDSSVDESVGGETHVDHARTRFEPRQDTPTVAAACDRTGPIPPHVRAPTGAERPSLSIVDPDRDTAQELDVESFVDLPAPEVRRPAAGPAPVTVRAIMLVVAAIAATTVVMLVA